MLPAAVRDRPRNRSVAHSIRVIELVVIVRGNSINLASMVDGSFQTRCNSVRTNLQGSGRTAGAALTDTKWMIMSSKNWSMVRKKC